MHASENNQIFKSMLQEANLISENDTHQNTIEKTVYLERMKDIIR